jgi:hypothetical protein
MCNIFDLFFNLNNRIFFYFIKKKQKPTSFIVVLDLRTNLCGIKLPDLSSHSTVIGNSPESLDDEVV